MIQLKRHRMYGSTIRNNHIEQTLYIMMYYVCVKFTNNLRVECVIGLYVTDLADRGAITRA